jgi:hypothetical protein
MQISPMLAEMGVAIMRDGQHDFTFLSDWIRNPNRTFATTPALGCGGQEPAKRTIGVSMCPTLPAR